MTNGAEQVAQFRQATLDVAEPLSADIIVYAGPITNDGDLKLMEAVHLLGSRPSLAAHPMQHIELGATFSAPILKENLLFLLILIVRVQEHSLRSVRTNS